MVLGECMYQLFPARFSSIGTVARVLLGSRGGGLLLGVLVTTGLIVPWMLTCCLLLCPLSSSASQNSSYKTSRFFSINNSSLKNQDTKSFVPTYSHELTWPLFSTTVFYFPFVLQDLASWPTFQLFDIEEEEGTKSLEIIWSLPHVASYTPKELVKSYSTKLCAAKKLRSHRKT